MSNLFTIMFTITLIIIHCSAVRPYQTSTAIQIDNWHRARGWNGIGYHYVILRDGTIQTGRPESKIGAHCAGHNAHSLGICYEGGLDTAGNPKDTRTRAQKRSLLQLLRTLKQKYPKALIMGHNVFNVHKSCPCFDAAEEYKDLQPGSDTTK